MTELSRRAPRGHSYRVYLVGGSTAVWYGWRPSTIDVDLRAEPEDIFRDVQELKERLSISVEFARPEDFVPALPGSDDRHVFIERVGRVSFYHHDPYAQAFSKIVRGFRRDLEDAKHFVDSGMVDPLELRDLVHRIPASAYAGYPALSREAILSVVDGFVAQFGR